MPSGGLDRLTDRERRILRLLAGGHSVKSAATEEGTSENAASELLRSARRKLGTGSSREAARLLADEEAGLQKIRDKKSVIPLGRAGAPSRSRFNIGIITMIAVGFIAVAALVLALQAGHSSKGMPMSAPKVVRTTPANGASIVQGRFTLEVTFDRPMLPQAYSFIRSDEGLYPECSSPPRLSTDGRTYSLDCVAHRPGKYVMYFNRPPYVNFREAETQISAEPARLQFTVSDK